MIAGMMSVPALNLMLGNVHVERAIQEYWEVQLRVVGDFAVVVHGQTIYDEMDFCVLEFALALGAWLGDATDNGPDMVYTSIDAETEGLVRFTCLGDGCWAVVAGHDGSKAEGVTSTKDLKDAALVF